MKVDIYYIKSPSNKIYIGQARQYLSNGKKWGTYGRWKSHINEANTYQNHCILLDNAIRKYNHSKFIVKTLITCENQNEANLMEKELIKEYNSLHPYGYNLRTGGYNTEDSDLTKKRKSESRIGKKHNEITKYKISNNQIGNRRDTKERKYYDDKNLPKYIVAYRKNNNIIGYYVKNFPIAKKDEEKKYAPNKTFTSSKLSLNEKLILAKKHLDYLKNKYNLPQ
tara:strand:- start:43 stop:714 length:672 start_codon:yes stop_codon:yes gene_type:complete